MRRNAIMSLAVCIWLAACGGSSSPAEDVIQDDLAMDETVGDAPVDTLPDRVDVPPDAVDAPLDAIDAPPDAIDAPADAPGCEGECGGGLCCDGRCVNPVFDPDHCGGCGAACPVENPFCSGGTCMPRPCETVCTGITTCCGSLCCEMDQICCIVQHAGPVDGPECHDGFCPMGCPLCL